MRIRQGLNCNGFRRSIRQGLVALLAALVVIPLAGMASALPRITFSSPFRWHMPLDTSSAMTEASHQLHPCNPLEG